MSRPIKWRKICCMPLNKTFAPSDGKPRKITMTIDEYKRSGSWIWKNYTQETCAMAMNVAGPHSKIYEARYKLADALINGKELSIEAIPPLGNHNQNYCPRFLPSIAARRTFTKTNNQSTGGVSHVEQNRQCSVLAVTNITQSCDHA